MSSSVSFRISPFQARRRRLLAAASLIAAVAAGSPCAFAGEIYQVNPAVTAEAAPNPAADRAPEGDQVAMRAMRMAQLEWLFGPRRPERAPTYSNNGYGGYGNDGGPIYAPRQYRPYGERVERVRRSHRLSNAALRRKMEERRERSRRLAQRRRELAAARADRNESDIWRGGFTEERVAARLQASEMPPPTRGPLLVTVSIDQQKLTLYDEGVPIAETPVSTGIRGRETPLGVFSVLQKEQWHRSNLYDDAPMPYMQRLTWDGIALHGGVVPPYPASHGCIRIPEKFAIRLWNTTQRGARVIISQAAVKPVEISHPLLFRARVEPPPTPESIPLPQPSPQRNPAPQPQNVPQVKLDHGSDPGHVVAADPEDIAAYIEEALADDMPSLREQVEETIPAIAEIAVVRGGRPVELVSIAPPAGKMKRPESRPMHATPATAQKAALREVTIIRGGRPTEVSTIEMSAEPQDIVRVADRPGNAAVASNGRGSELPIMIAYGGDDAAELIARLNPRLAQSLGGPIPDAAAAPAPAPVAPPAPVAVDPMKRKGKLSVFISRAAQRIYVRKGFRAVFDMPIKISMPRRPMGTYVFTANALADNDNAFRWTAVAVGDGGEGRERYDTDRSDLHDALRALDRIQLPKEATDKLAQMVGAGASIIVSDKWPVKPGETDDFSVILKAAPQNATLPTEPKTKARAGAKVRR